MLESPDSSAAEADVQIQWDVKIPLRDGVRLNATLYLPGKMQGASPVIATLTPYVAQMWHPFAIYFASRGWPFVAVDVRGRGDSEGEFKPNINEARDGCDVVEWLHRQPYCNGQVAMWGGSYAGYAQWATASQLPPHLASIVPAAAPCFGVDFPLRNNIPRSYIMQWLVFVRGRALHDRVFADQSYWSQRFRRWLQSGTSFATLDRYFGNASPVFQEWLAHPHRDAYWDSYNPTAQQYARIDIPVLTITGIYDGDQPGALAHYREHMANTTAEGRARHYLVIGPWDHAGTRIPTAECGGLKFGPASLVDLRALHLQWYAWTMRGGSKPGLLRKNVAYYVLGAEEWRYSDTLEAVTARYQSYHLQSTSNATDVFASGTLDLEAPCGGPDQVTHDPRDSSLAQLESEIDAENRVDQRMVLASIGRQFVYHSATFGQATEVSGFFRLSLWLAIDQADVDLRVGIYEIAIDGSSIELTTDYLRARYRESLREPKLIDSRDPLRYDFEQFTFVARRIEQGSRLRLVIAPLNSIHWQKNYSSGGVVSDESVRDARLVTMKLFHDESHPSALHMPIGIKEGE